MATGPKRFYLLGKDADGEKKTVIRGFDTTRVHKGELGYMTDDQPANKTFVKLRIVDRPSAGEVTAFYKLEDAFLLSEADAELLRGVRTQDARLNMFTTPGLLAEVRSLEDGTAVTVQHSRGGKYDGFIRWHGQHEKKPGTLFGVELLKPVRLSSVCCQANSGSLDIAKHSIGFQHCGKKIVPPSLSNFQPLPHPLFLPPSVPLRPHPSLSSSLLGENRFLYKLVQVSQQSEPNQA